MATLTPSTVVHPSLDYDSTMNMRLSECGILFDLHWSQEPFDGSIDLPLIDVPSQLLETGYNRFNAEQLRCANNCSGDWGDLFDDATRSGNFSRVRLRERQLSFEINRRWVIAAGPHRAALQAARLRVWVEVMWYFHMMRRLRLGLCAPGPLAPSACPIERLSAPRPPASGLSHPQRVSRPTTSPPPFVSRVIPALDAEMAASSRSAGRRTLPAEYQINEELLQDPSVIPVQERLERLKRRRNKFPRPIDTRFPQYLRNARVAPYPLPSPPKSLPSSSSSDDNVRLLEEALASPKRPPVEHYSPLGTILCSAAPSLPADATSSSPVGSSSQASTGTTVPNSSPVGSYSQASTATTVPNSPISRSPRQSSSPTPSHSTNTNVLHSHPTDPMELLSRLGSRFSPGEPSHFDILTACLKRVLPNHAVTSSCQFLVDELSQAGIERAHSSMNSLERVAERFRRVIAEELAVRRDALRRRESSLVSLWEDEYLRNAREDKKFDADVAELLHGRRPSPSPPPSPRHEHPYFVSSVRPSGLRAPPTSRIGPAPPPASPSSESIFPPTSAAIQQLGSPTSTTSASRKRRRSTPPPPPPSPTRTDPTTAMNGDVVWDDPTPIGTRTDPTTAMNGDIVWDDPTPIGGDAIVWDVDEPDVDEEKVIASSFYQDLARDLSVDVSIDGAMVRTLTEIAEGAPEDVLNKCIDDMMEAGTS